MGFRRALSGRAGRCCRHLSPSTGQEVTAPTPSASVSPSVDGPTSGTSDRRHQTSPLPSMATGSIQAAEGCVVGDLELSLCPGGELGVLSAVNFC